MSILPRKSQVQRLVKAYENQDQGFATSDQAERAAAGTLKRVRQNSSKREQDQAVRAYEQKHGRRPRQGYDGYPD